MRRTDRALAAGLILLGWCRTAIAEPTPTLAETVDRAESIFAGTVDRAWVEGDRRVHVPVERAIFHHTVVLKGWRSSRIPISLWVRQEGEHPRARAQLRKGERYIVLTPEPLDVERAGYKTISARDLVLYPILRDDRLGKAVVHDPARFPIARITRDEIVVVGKKAGSTGGSGASSRPPHGEASWIRVLPPDQDPGTRVSEDEFLGVLRELLATSTHPRR